MLTGDMLIEECVPLPWKARHWNLVLAYGADPNEYYSQDVEKLLILHLQFYTNSD